MAVPVPYDWTSTPTPGATPLNAGIRDVLAFLLDPPHARAYRATAGTALTAGTPTVVNLDGENYDSTGGMHSTVSNLGRIIAPEDGVYQVYAQVGVVQTIGGSVTCDLRTNGTTVQASCRVPTISTGGVSTVAQVLSDIPMTAGDYVEMLANFAQTASPVAGINITFMQARWVTTL